MREDLREFRFFIVSKIPNRDVVETIHRLNLIGARHILEPTVIDEEFNIIIFAWHEKVVRETRFNSFLYFVEEYLTIGEDRPSVRSVGELNERYQQFAERQYLAIGGGRGKFLVKTPAYPNGKVCNSYDASTLLGEYVPTEDEIAFNGQIFDMILNMDEGEERSHPPFYVKRLF